MAVKPEILSRKAHGLQFHSGALFECSARPSSGTFTDYLNARSITVDPHFCLSLRECLERISEMSGPLVESGRARRTVPVIVEVWLSGRVVLRFDGRFMADASSFQAWRHDYQSLASVCEDGDESLTLKKVEPVTDDDQFAERVSEFCHAHLLPDLATPDDPTWFALRVGSETMLPRDAYYFVAMFILSNVVRYEPEQLGTASKLGSEDGWLLRKFLSNAERFFPQLLLSWLYNSPVDVRHA
jgi:hypothetical protein